jgi:hypothetical protein
MTPAVEHYVRTQASHRRIVVGFDGSDQALDALARSTCLRGTAARH